jgi:hypothetical protein
MDLPYWEMGTSAVLLILLIAAFVLGGLIGGGRKDDRENLGVLQGATLGLIGLVLGFSFSGATSRFIERQDIIVREANAIGTAWLRFDLLDPAHRDRLRPLLVDYTTARIALTQTNDPVNTQSLKGRLATLQQNLWTTAVSGVEARPATAMLVLPPLNELFDLLSTRNAATRRHIPPAAMALVLATVALGAAMLGYGQRANSFTVRLSAFVVVLLLAGLVWLIIDLDFPRRGLVKISDVPLREVLQSITPAPTPPPPPG